MSKATERQEPKSIRWRFLDSGEENDEKIQDETCLVAQAPNEICFESSYFSDENSSIDDLALDNEYDKLCKMIDLEPDEWIKDSGCSKHMMGNRKLFSTYKAYNGGNVIFGSNLRGNIIGKGYSQNSKAYIILNKHTRKVEESLNVTFDETPPPSKTSPLVNDDLDEEEAIKVTEKKNLENDIMDETLEVDEIVNIKESRNHPLENVIGNLNQRTLEMLKKFGLEESKPMKTPMSSDTKLTKDEECESVDSTNFQEAPKISHLEAVKRIFRYIKGTTHLGLWYPKGTDIETVVYADSDHAGDYVDRKSTSGICTFVGCCLTSWFSKKQTALAISTTEAEYVSAEKACQQALWMYSQALMISTYDSNDVPIM
ncbi:hypothetical protein Tco_0191445 [Tanacetum coccineum]